MIPHLRATILQVNHKHLRNLHHKTHLKPNQSMQQSQLINLFDQILQYSQQNQLKYQKHQINSTHLNRNSFLH